MAIRDMLLDTFVHMPPAHALGDLDADDAVRVPAEGLHSIAALLGHMEYWQAWLLDRIEGQSRAMPASAADGWPVVTAGDWLHLLGRFEGGVARAAALGSDADRLDAPLSPAIEFPPLAHYTVRDALVHLAQHNSHHLGQVVSARQVLELWPPRAGSWTW
jgi:uncharacterized damage-inducible protein DinB